MNPVLSLLKVAPIGEILGHPASCVFVPREVFKEYHLKAFDCTIIGEFLEITRFVVLDKGQGHGSRLLADLNEWARNKGIRLCLTPQPYGDISAKSMKRLIRFYERNGFVMVNDDLWCPEAMYRP